MKKIVNRVLLTLLMMGTLLTVSFADGGAPPILCFPGQCNVQTNAR